MSEKREITRRKFVKDAAIAGAGLTIVPRHVLGKGMTPPSDLLNIAGVGIGGMGRAGGHAQTLLPQARWSSPRLSVGA